MRTEPEVERAVNQYADMVRRVCFLHLNSHADTEDIFQTVFLKYALYRGAFENPEHEKAWFIRVTINACNDLKRLWFRRKTVPLDMMAEAEAASPRQREVLAAVLDLPPKYRDAIYLHYYEGYSAARIAAITSQKENTVYSLLARGRNRLKESLEGELL